MKETNDNEENEQSEPLSFRDKYRFLIMILSAVLITFMMTSISLALYKSSGAYQLDLSRPGFTDVRSQVEKDDSFQNYSSAGAIDQAAITSFKDAYSEQASKAQAVDAFSGDPLSPENLGFVVNTAD